MIKEFFYQPNLCTHLFQVSHSNENVLPNIPRKSAEYNFQAHSDFLQLTYVSFADK